MGRKNEKFCCSVHVFDVKTLRGAFFEGVCQNEFFIILRRLARDTRVARAFLDDAARIGKFENVRSRAREARCFRRENDDVAYRRLVEVGAFYQHAERVRRSVGLIDGAGEIGFESSAAAQARALMPVKAVLADRKSVV